MTSNCKKSIILDFILRLKYYMVEVKSRTSKNIEQIKIELALKG